MRERFLMEKNLFFVDVIFVNIPITSYARIHFAPREKIQRIEPQCADGPININEISLPDGCFFLKILDGTLLDDFAHQGSTSVEVVKCF